MVVKRLRIIAGIAPVNPGCRGRRGVVGGVRHNRVGVVIAHRLDVVLGGEGDDTLYGGTGADRFVFDGLSSTGRGDVIVDFKSSEGDKLVFDHGFFKALEGMTTLSDHVRSYTASSVGGDDYIVYDNTTGNLYYDPTGLNNASAVLIANLQNKPLTMAANAFVVL